MNKCALTGEDTELVFSLGTQYINGFLETIDVNWPKVNLNLRMGPTGLVQLDEAYSRDAMYREYWYGSSINEMMRKELAEIANECQTFVKLEPGDWVVDIASNSGELLTNYPRYVNRIGVDPCNIAKESDLYDQHGIALVNDYFELDKYPDRDRKHKIVTVIAMFYDLPDPKKFCKEVREIMHEDGILCIQMSYFPMMLGTLEVGNISEEHLCYYTLNTLSQALRPYFSVVDVQVNATNGGSFRVYARPVDNQTFEINESRAVFDTIPGIVRLDSIAAFEKRNNFDTPAGIKKAIQVFAEELDKQRKRTIDLLWNLKKEGKTVLGYGASTKGNTLLQYFGITPELIPAIAERYEPKWGRYTAGSWIPIISEDEMRARKPDYLFVLPWHFINSFRKREIDFLNNGGKFIVPLPKAEIISKD